MKVVHAETLVHEFSFMKPEIMQAAMSLFHTVASTLNHHTSSQQKLSKEKAGET